jgi:hypothetical protein
VGRPRRQRPLGRAEPTERRRVRPGRRLVALVASRMTPTRPLPAPPMDSCPRGLPRARRATGLCRCLTAPRRWERHETGVARRHRSAR